MISVAGAQAIQELRTQDARALEVSREGAHDVRSERLERVEGEFEQAEMGVDILHLVMVLDVIRLLLLLLLGSLLLPGEQTSYKHNLSHF